MNAYECLQSLVSNLNCVWHEGPVKHRRAVVCLLCVKCTPSNATEVNGLHILLRTSVLVSQDLKQGTG